MHLSSVLLLAALLCLGICSADASITRTQYQSTTCDKSNQTAFYQQIVSSSFCLGGTMYPFRQEESPAVRNYTCLGEQLSYTSCEMTTPYCTVGCSAPVNVSSECIPWLDNEYADYLSCTESLDTPLISGTHFQSVYSNGSTIFGSTYCGEDNSFEVTFSCNSTHVTETHCTSDSDCQEGCETFSVTPLAANVCTNSKQLACYYGATTDGVPTGPNAIYNATVNSDQECARYDFTCAVGIDSCTTNEQNEGTCKHGFEVFSSAICAYVLQYPMYYANPLCCDTPLCNTVSQSPDCSLPPSSSSSSSSLAASATTSSSSSSAAASSGSSASTLSSGSTTSSQTSPTTTSGSSIVVVSCFGVLAAIFFHSLL